MVDGENAARILVLNKILHLDGAFVNGGGLGDMNFSRYQINIFKIILLVHEFCKIINIHENESLQSTFCLSKRIALIINSNFELKASL